jgi:hypothetical protein
MDTSEINNEISSEGQISDSTGLFEGSRLAAYRPTQQLALTRYGRLKMLQRDVLPKLDPSDMRVKLTLKALYSTYRDLEELGLGEEARLLRDRDEPETKPETD